MADKKKTKTGVKSLKNRKTPIKPAKDIPNLTNQLNNAIKQSAKLKQLVGQFTEYIGK